MNEKVMELYKNGYELDNIALDLSIGVDNIKEYLLCYKDKNMPKRRFNNEMKQTMIERYGSGVAATQIEREFKLGKNSLTRILKQLGLFELRGKSLEYKVITYDSFEVCPECSSRKVNDVNSHLAMENRIDLSPNSYCRDCGTEWYMDDGKVKQVIFENMA